MGWWKWRKFSEVLCDAKIPRRLESKFYRAVMRPTTIYVSECWPPTKKDETRISAMKTKMLRKCSGIRLLDHITNKITRRAVEIASQRQTKERLSWFGHFVTRDRSHKTRQAMESVAEVTRPRERPKLRWLKKEKRI